MSEDLSKVSDADLMAAIKGGQAPGPDLSQVSDADLMAAIKGAQPQPGYGEDIAKSAVAGVGEGAIGLAGTPGDIGAGTRAALKYFGVPDDKIDMAAKALSAVPGMGPVVAAARGPTSEQIKGAVTPYTGEFYQSQTVPGKLARSVGQMIPATVAAGPTGLLAKSAVAVGSGIGSELAGMATEGTAAEPFARAAGAVAGGGAGMRTITPRVRAAEPRFIEGLQGPKGKVAEALAQVPVIGTPIKQAAQEAKAGIATRAEEGITRPTGAAPDPAAAGAYIQDLIQRKRAGTSLESITQIMGAQPENVPAILVQWASKGKGSDLTSLAKLRSKSDPVGGANVQGAVFQELGMTPEGFDGAIAIRRYQKELSDGGKNLLFGQKGGLREFYDSLAADSSRLEGLNKIIAPNKLDARAVYRDARIAWMAKGLLGAAGLGGVVTGALNPLTLLSAGVGARALSSWLATPAKASSVAAWSRAYTRYVTEGTPAAVANLKIATTNLQNTTGADLGPQGAQPQMAGEQQNVNSQGIPPESDYWDSLQGIIPHTQRMAPRGIPWQTMRRSTNVETAPNRSTPISKRDQAAATNAWLNEAENSPATKLGIEAGLADLGRQQLAYGMRQRSGK